MSKLENLGWFALSVMVVVYISLMNLFFEYIINREANQVIQTLGLLIMLAYTVFIMRVLVLNVTRIINIKNKKND